MANFCNTCTFWEKDIFNRAGTTFGSCSNTHVAGGVVHDAEQHLYEGQVYTAENFGCVHWRGNTGILIDVNKTVKK